MENREIGSLLRSLTPARAPQAVEEHVLRVADAVVRRGRSRLLRRRLLLAATAAAALVVVLLEPVFVVRSPVRPAGRDTETAQVLPRTLSPRSEETLAGQAGILELKLARLKQLATHVESRSSIEADLDLLEKDLKTIKSLYLDTLPIEQENGKGAQDRKKGSSHEENGRFHYRFVVDPFHGGARPG